MIFRRSVQSVVILLVFLSHITAKPYDDKIIFRDDDVDEEVRLEDENQILPSNDDLKQLGDAGNEIVQQQLENGNFYQGDIVLLQDQKDYLFATNADNSSVPTRTGWIHEFYRWPKDKSGNVMVPYVISPKAKFCKKDDETSFKGTSSFSRIR